MSPGARSDVEALQDEVARLRAELLRQRESFHRELMRKAYRIADLEQRSEEAAREAQGYRGSVSWRATAPLRVAKRALRRQ